MLWLVNSHHIYHNNSYLCGVKLPKTGERYSKFQAVIVALIVILLLVAVYCLSTSKDSSEIIREKGLQYLEEAKELELCRHSRLVVKGLEYRKDQAINALQDANDGDPVQLVLEPDNEYDRFAVKVCYNDIHVGYIPRYLSREVSENINRVQKCVIASVITFTTIPHLQIDLEYFREKGLSQEAIDFIMKH